MVRDAVQHVRDAAADPRPWLVLGKGPTSDRLASVDLAGYRVLTLNHACRLAKPDLAHFVDWEAFAACADELATAGTTTCLPWNPHDDNRPSKKNLSLRQSLFGKNGRAGVALAWMWANDRLLSYNATTAPVGWRNHKLPTVRLRHFSAVAAFNLLAVAGVKAVASLGVDGGTAYGTAFGGLRPLTNGRDSFDAQFAEIDRTVRAHRMSWTRLGTDPISTNGK